MQAISDEARVRATIESEFGPEAAPLLSMLRPSLRMVDDGGDAKDAPVRLGGPGVLVRGRPWPTWRDRPLTFLAAIDCRAAHALLPETQLPTTGTVTAWVHRDEDGSPSHLLRGPSSRHADASKLMHHPEGVALQEQEPPEETRDTSTTEGRSMRLVRDVMLPIDLYRLRRHHPSLKLTEDHIALAEKLLDEAAADDPDTWIQNRIGGWPTLHTAEETVALIDAGMVDDRGSPDHKAEGAAQLVADACQQWRPLLQLGANLDLGWNWFLDGVLMFLGRPGAPVEDAITYCSRQ